jgi:hypothetical protein
MWMSVTWATSLSESADSSALSPPPITSTRLPRLSSTSGMPYVTPRPLSSASPGLLILRGSKAPPPVATMTLRAS